MVDDVPGLGALGPSVERFDEWADAQLERLRGHPVADRLFETASTLGDFSVVWHIVNVGRGVLGGRRRLAQVPKLALLIGAESLIVNQGIKRLFNRQRPTATATSASTSASPPTSSFPSGHASAAGFAATTLTSWDGPAERGPVVADRRRRRHVTGLRAHPPRLRRDRRHGRRRGAREASPVDSCADGLTARTAPARRGRLGGWPTTPRRSGPRSRSASRHGTPRRSIAR